MDQRSSSAAAGCTVSVSKAAPEAPAHRPGLGEAGLDKLVTALALIATLGIILFAPLG